MLEGLAADLVARSINILDLLLPRRLEREREFLFDFLRHLTRDANPAWSSQLLQPRCDVHPFATAVFAINNHLADVGADAHVEPFLFRHGGVALGHSTLKRHGALDSINHTAELDEEAIAHQLEDSPVMLVDLGLE